MNRLSSTLFVFFVVASIFPLCVTASAQEPSNVEVANARIRELQQERVDVLQAAVELALAQYRGGHRTSGLFTQYSTNCSMRGLIWPRLATSVFDCLHLN